MKEKKKKKALWLTATTSFCFVYYLYPRFDIS